MSVNKYEKFGSRGFAPSSNTAGNAEGDIVFIGSTSSGETDVVAGRLYYLNDDLNWYHADADAVGTSTNLLGIAIGSGAPGVVGMLLRGMVTISVAPEGGAGAPLYISTSVGQITRVAPSGAGDVVRIVGYNVAAGTDNKIWFNPDNTWVEITG